MAIKPILFNTEMVRAILDGRKSCTRRIVKPKQFVGLLPDKCKNGVPEEFLKEKKFMFKPYCDMTDSELIMASYKEPYQQGDILYVRETWFKGLKRYMYRADYTDVEKYYQNGKEVSIKWHPSIHMPKEAARIWLKVMDVKVERLQEISGEDLIKEGIDLFQSSYLRVAFDEFKNIWNSTIKKSDLDTYGWDANPYVWVIEFERYEKPRK